MYGNINRQKEESSTADLLWHALYSGRSFLCTDLIYSSDSTLIEGVREERIQRKREREIFGSAPSGWSLSHT